MNNISYIPVPYILIKAISLIKHMTHSSNITYIPIYTVRKLCPTPFYVNNSIIFQLWNSLFTSKVVGLSELDEGNPTARPPSLVALQPPLHDGVC